MPLLTPKVGVCALPKGARGHLPPGVPPRWRGRLKKLQNVAISDTLLLTTLLPLLRQCVGGTSFWVPTPELVTERLSLGPPG